MILDASLPPVPLKSIPEIARGAEATGFTALWSTETIHDPFLPGALIAEHSQRLCFGTAIAIAFARSPATLAYTAWDLAQASGGRFILGLGTQVKAHIERRFGMPWPDSVVGKLREQIAALRAFWNTWQTGAAVGFPRRVLPPEPHVAFLQPGADRAPPDTHLYCRGQPGSGAPGGRNRAGLSRPPLPYAPISEPGAAPGHPARVGPFRPPACRFQPIRHRLCGHLAGRRPVCALADRLLRLDPLLQSGDGLSWLAGDRRTALHLARQGRWGEMPGLVTDEMLAACAVVCPPEELGRRLKERYAGLADRLGLYLPFVPGQRDEFWQTLVRQVAG